jgi:Ca-activated chloride channel family protein
LQSAAAHVIWEDAMLRQLSTLSVWMFVWLLVGTVSFGQPGPSLSQAPSSGIVISGTVVDSAMGVIPGVKVTLERAGKDVASVVTTAAGTFRFDPVAPGTYRIRAELTGFKTATREVSVVNGTAFAPLRIVMEIGALTEEVMVSSSASVLGVQTSTVSTSHLRSSRSLDQIEAVPVAPDTASYARRENNRFQLTSERAVSTFGADVDTASYSNVRRFLASGRLPPVDAVRVEELLNYFRFDYTEPERGRPIGISTEVGECPWAPSHRLVLVGARAKASQKREERARNIVLLLDVSGSMAPAERLPLLKTAFGMFVDTLRDDDRLAIVTYAGTSGIALPSTPIRARDRIHAAIDALNAGGSTNGAQGLVTAYQVARRAFVPGGVNRVILATDGDFNVGVTDQRDLVRLIERERESGVFLSIIGVGTDNLQDSTMEALADRGNGHYAYFDSLQEARRVLIREGDATLETVAKDVKFQVEFNPATVRAWKLIGYEDRLLRRRDFNDDRKDGGEMGAGHTVTVLYEIVPAGVDSSMEGDARGRPNVDPLKYQSSDRAVVSKTATRVPAADADELLTVKVRYKQPDGTASSVMEQAVRAGGPARDLPFASAVAEFGLLLRDERAPMARWDDFLRRFNALNLAADSAPDRQGFVNLVDVAAGLRRLHR